MVDPRTGEEILRVDEGSAEDVEIAVHAASEAFTNGEWPRTAGQVSTVGLHVSLQGSAAAILD